MSAGGDRPSIISARHTGGYPVYWSEIRCEAEARMLQLWLRDPRHAKVLAADLARMLITIDAKFWWSESRFQLSRKSFRIISASAL